MIRILLSKVLLISVLCFLSLSLHAQYIEYVKTDSVAIEKILKSADEDKIDIVGLAKHFVGNPYMANSLEEGNEEHLIVNTRQFDCLTFIETIASLYMCSVNGEHKFEDFCKRLQSLRYRNGIIVDYTYRLHYFSWWAYDNEKRGNLSAIDKPDSVFSSKQIIDNTFMSSNPSRYKHLIKSVDFQSKIRYYEDELNGSSFSYLPKSELNNPNLLEWIKSGDIIAIVTNKKGLDIAHVGFAVWVKGKLHLMHSSSQKNRVVIDKRTLFEYCADNRTFLGVRFFKLSE